MLIVACIVALQNHMRFVACDLSTELKFKKMHACVDLERNARIQIK
jgi:hypothetical protein